MKFEEIKELVIEYGNACEAFGDYQSTANGQAAFILEDKLLGVIKKLLENA